MPSRGDDCICLIQASLRDAVSSIIATRLSKAGLNSWRSLRDEKLNKSFLKFEVYLGGEIRGNTTTPSVVVVPFALSFSMMRISS